MPHGTSDELGFPRLIPPSEAARILGRKKQTLARWRCQGNGPPYVKLNGRVFYPENQIREFLGQFGLRRSTSDRLPGPRPEEVQASGCPEDGGAPTESGPRVLVGRIPKFEGPLWNLDPSAGDEIGPTRSRRPGRVEGERAQQRHRRSSAIRPRRR